MFHFVHRRKKRKKKEETKESQREREREGGREREKEKKKERKKQNEFWFASAGKDWVSSIEDCKLLCTSVSSCQGDAAESRPVEGVLGLGLVYAQTNSRKLPEGLCKWNPVLGASMLAWGRVGLVCGWFAGLGLVYRWFVVGLWLVCGWFVVGLWVWGWFRGSLCLAYGFRVGLGLVAKYGRRAKVSRLRGNKKKKMLFKQ